MVNIKAEFGNCRRESLALTGTGILMSVAFAFSLAGLYLDPRIITGAPAWLKPAKFAISTAIFSFTLAWIYRYITRWPALKRTLGWVLAAVLVLEVALIDWQAARGTSSHFNIANTFDAALFSIMGVSIGVLWLAMIAVLVMLWKQRFEDISWGWALRLGMLISVLGAASAGLMLRPTPPQSMLMAHHQRPAAVGAHTVGAPDGGPGLPVVAWSEHHGDLRVPHFFGLHGLQLLPLVWWLLTRGKKAGRDRQATRLVFATAASYCAFIGLLTWQALRGQSIAEPDAATVIGFAIWLVVTLAAVLMARTGAQTSSHATFARNQL